MSFNGLINLRLPDMLDIDDDIWQPETDKRLTAIYEA